MLLTWEVYQVEVDEDPAEAKKDEESDTKTEVFNFIYQFIF